MHIKDFLVTCKFGGGKCDFDFVEEMMNFHDIDISENDVEEINHINDLISWVFDKIVEKWNAYIVENGGKEIALCYSCNCLDSRIDDTGDYRWDMTPEEAYEEYMHMKEKEEV